MSWGLGCCALMPGGCRDVNMIWLFSRLVTDRSCDRGLYAKRLLQEKVCVKHGANINKAGSLIKNDSKSEYTLSKFKRIVQLASAK